MPERKEYWCVTRDDGDESYKAHGPYSTEEAASAFDDGIEYAQAIELVSLGVFRAVDEDDAIEFAKAHEEESNKPD